MEDVTLKALKESIEKWERNAVAETPDGFTTGPGGCALCERFWDDFCQGCPVRAFTGAGDCHDTPYDAALNAKNDWLFSQPWPDGRDSERRAAAHAAAREEVAFLRSLLPEVEDR